MKKRVIIALFCILSVLMLFSCNKSQYDDSYVYDGKSLIGSWQEKSGNEIRYVVYNFYENGKADRTSYIYGIEELSVEYDYRIEGNNKIILFNENGNYSENYFSIKDGEITVSDGKNDVNYLVPNTADYIIPREIIGKWQDRNSKDDIFVFCEDGTGKASNDKAQNSLLFSSRGSKIYIFLSDFYILDEESIVIADYSIDNNILTISNNGQELVFERVENGTE